MRKPSGDSLYKFELFYEDMENKVKKTIDKPKTTFKARLESVKDSVRGRFDNIVRKFKKQPKKTQKVTKMKKKELHEQRKRAILGIGLLLVIVSIIYSTTVVREFVDSPGSLVALAPQVIFAGVILIKAFSKIYK